MREKTNCSQNDVVGCIDKTVQAVQTSDSTNKKALAPYEGNQCANETNKLIIQMVEEECFLLCWDKRIILYFFVEKKVKRERRVNDERDPPIGAPSGGSTGDRRGQWRDAQREDEGHPGHARHARWPRPPLLSVRFRSHRALRHGHHQWLPFRHRLPVPTTTVVLFFLCLSILLIGFCWWESWLFEFMGSFVGNWVLVLLWNWGLIHWSISLQIIP